MVKMKAKYNGKCRKCGQPIQVGDEIDWEKGIGASHAVCPASPSPKSSVYEPKKIEMEQIPEVPSEYKDKIVQIYWRDGEYLDGYTVDDPLNILEKLHVCNYVSGWGMYLEPFVTEKLGEKFTYGQVEELVRPKLLEKSRIEYEKKLQKENEKKEKFEQAKRENKPIILYEYTTDCDGSTEECSVDIVRVLAMPDGTTKKSRSHTY